MIEAIYPTPIFQKQVRDTQLIPIQREVEIVCGKLSFNAGHLQTQWGDDHFRISDSTGRQNIIKQYNLNSLDRYINQCMDEYTAYCSGGQVLPYTIHQSWMTKSGRGQSAARHAHGQFDVSGVYYHKTNGKDGSIRFHNPNLGQEASKVWMKQFMAQLQPDVGTLVLFPGWLDHSVEVNNTDDCRMSLAFNMNIDRSKLFQE